MKIFFPLSVVLRIAFWLAIVATIFGLAAGQDSGSAPSHSTSTPAALPHSVAVFRDGG